MAGGVLGATLRDVRQVFDGGTVAGLTDSQLLDRFAGRGDESAFGAIVARHGRMVLAVGRNVLRDSHDAEDAFQATFLVLARKARSVRARGSLGAWLHRVAFRVALQANADAARRRRLEVRGTPSPNEPNAESQASRDETRRLVHDELRRLPDRYREAVVLCDLEGLTREQAAEALRLPVGTVGSRQARGRNLLRERLLRRGVAPAVAASALGAEASAAVPESWVAAAVKAAALARTGAAAGAAVALAERVLRSSVRALLTPLALAAAGGGAVAWAALAGVVGGTNPIPPAQSAASSPNEPKPAPGALSPNEPNPVAGALRPNEPKSAALAPNPNEPNPDDAQEFRGVVLDPDGKPVAGASVLAQLFPNRIRHSRFDVHNIPIRRAADRTDAQGRFRFTINRAQSGAKRTQSAAAAYTTLVAVAPGFSSGTAGIIASDWKGELTLRLVPEGPPISGRVLDIEGKPVAGVSVHAQQLSVPRDGLDADALLAGGRFNHDDVVTQLHDPDWLTGGSSLVTGADGRFTIDGVGRDRVVHLLLSGPATQTVEVCAMARPSTGKAVEPKPDDRAMLPTSENGRPHGRAPAPRLYGATFDVVVAPTKPVTGVVTLKATGEPAAGVTVVGIEPVSWTEVEATTDGQGRFRLVGLPKADLANVRAVVEPGKPFRSTDVRVAGTPGLAPVDVRLALPEGVTLKGRLVEKGTGRVVPAAEVRYTETPSNRHKGGDNGWRNEPDGTFVMTVSSGVGMVYGRVEPEKAPYTRARLRKEDRGKGVGGFGDNEPLTVILNAFHSYKFIDVPEGAKEFTVDLELSRGDDLPGRLVDEAGAPVRGAEAYGLEAGWGRITRLDGDGFKVIGIDPAEPRLLVFTHKERKLAATFLFDGKAPTPAGPIEVAMKPAGAVVGRLVDEQGDPLQGVALTVTTLEASGTNLPSQERGAIWPNDTEFPTDEDGRFRVEGIAPGTKFRLEVIRKGHREKPFPFVEGFLDLTIDAAGAVKDMGQVRVKTLGLE